MSKKQKAQASSVKAAAPTGSTFGPSFGASSGGFGSASSKLSYLAEQPDLSLLADSNLIVMFRNLSKKDSTTKSKALEELQFYLTSLKQGQDDVDESFLSAWIKIYPRLSIDVDRRVRLLSHTVHGSILSASGKKAAKYMSDCIGVWVAGCYEGDKVVSRAAQDAFGSVFPSSEKQSSINKVYHLPILEFCRDAIVNETPRSLSDERTTKPEDADAKYYRLVASSLSLLHALLNKLPEDQIQKHIEMYQEILEADKTWSFAESPEPSVRRSLLRLITTTQQRMSDVVSPFLPRIFGALLSKRSIKSQAGSALEYSNVLIALASANPEFWTQIGKDPSSAVTRFADLAKQGSQGASGQYWKNMLRLLTLMPSKCLPHDADQAIKLLSSIQSGITRKDEPRTHANDSWASYNAVLGLLLERLPSQDQEKVLSNMAMVIVRQFLRPASETSSWTIGAKQPAPIVAGLFREPSMVDLAVSAYPDLTNVLVDVIRTSQPEQSNDFESSQHAVIQDASRWFELERCILATSSSEQLQDVILSTSTRIMSESIDTLKSRNGKPFGAAGVIDIALQQVGGILLSSQQILDLLESFLENDLPSLISSPSSLHLISILYAMQKSTQFESALSKVMEQVLNGPDGPEKENSLKQMFTASNTPDIVVEMAVNNQELQAFLNRRIKKTLDGDGRWPEVAQYLTASTPVLSSSNVDATLAELASRLTMEHAASNAVSGLETISHANSKAVHNFVNTAQGSPLMQHLLLLLESSDELLARRAATLSSELSSSASRPDGQTPSASATETVIANGLSDAGPQSLAVESLIEFARSTINDAPERQVELAQSFLPSPEAWSTALSPLLEAPVPKSLAIRTDTDHALLLLDDNSASKMASLASFDRDGFSAALRMAIFSLTMITDFPIWDALSQETQASIYRLLILTFHLANDNISLAKSNFVCTCDGIHSEKLVLDFLDGVRKLVTTFTEGSSDLSGGFGTASQASFVSLAQKAMLADSKDLSPVAFHNARAYASNTSQIIESHTWHPQPGLDLEDTLKSLRKRSDILQLLVFVKAFKSPLSATKRYSRACNELVATLTTVDPTAEPDESLRSLLLVNTMLGVDDHPVIESIAKQRVVFLYKHVIPWLTDASVSQEICTETCRLFTLLLPVMADVYGDHWSQLLLFVQQTCTQVELSEKTITSSSILPLLHSTLRLSKHIRDLTHAEESNEDLTDAWAESQSALSATFVTLIKKLSSFPDAQNQPLQSVNELVGREIAALPPKDLGDLDEIYPLMTSESQPVQRTAFDLLHKRIPAMQEQISVDTALDKTAARLPDELLSLILEPLTLDSLVDASFEREMPSVARSYLSSWLLIFDHFRNASDKVCSDYTAHLREGSYLTPLLDFLSDFLGHSRGKPIDASKFEVSIYSFDVQDDPLKDMQWLLIHLYYLTLKRTPTLTKAWWKDCRSRQTVQNIESWTEKYISPSVITDALNTVSTWANTQDPNADDAIKIKTNHRAKEITLAKELDAQVLSLAIKLPPTYPLGLATCHSLNRVAVEAKKWHTWLLNTQGVIAFSNNSLIEGIVAFRRNVNGALKGQTECAICYAIVGADRQLPTKRCGTCKNLFHGSCLYRWFKSSNSSSCPLCRNGFNYS